MHIIGEILQQYSEFICAVIGALIAWGCTELSRHFANSYQKRQTLNSTLSLLLELYFQIWRIYSIYVQMQECSKWYYDFLSKKECLTEVKDEVTKLMRSKVTTFLSFLVSDEIRGLSVDYEKALGELARYYPVNVYRLRGRADIKYILTDIDVYFKKVEELFSISMSQFDGVLSSLTSELQPNMFQGNLDVLKDEILELSKHVNYHQRREIEQTLDHINALNENFEQHIELLKEQIESAFDEALKKLANLNKQETNNE